MTSRVRSLALVAASCVLLVPGRPAAEPYVAGFLGGAATVSTDLDTRLEVDGVTITEGRLKDLSFDSSAVFGAKAGYFFDRVLLIGNVGLELEVHHSQPEADGQTVRFSGTSMGMAVEADTVIQRADIDVTAVGLNALYRVPFRPDALVPQGRIQPYGGVGIGLFIATLETTTTPFDVNRRIDATDVQPGIQVIAGTRLFLTRRVALFLEYRFLRTAEFRFDFRESGTVRGVPAMETARDRADLTQHQAILGVGFHW